MDTYPAPAMTDSLGRRTGPRRRRSAEEKRRIVQEAFQPGVSAAVVARQHDLNANVLFRWRREYLKEHPVTGEAAGLIPVKLVEPDVRRDAGKPVDVPPHEALTVELQTSAGAVLKISGQLAREGLREILARILPR